MSLLVAIAGAGQMVTRILLALRSSPWPALLPSAGTLKVVDVPLERVVGLRSTFDVAAIRRRDGPDLAFVAYPNVVDDNDAPPPGRRGMRAIARRLDDPAAFVVATGRLGGQR